MALKPLKDWAGRIFKKLTGAQTYSSDSEGWIYNQDDQKLKTHIGGADREIATLDQTQSMSNKTLETPVVNGTVSGTAIKNEADMVSNSASHLATQQSIKSYVDAKVAEKDEASEIAYSNATSGLTATDVQAAVDEVEGRVDSAETNITNHLNDTVDAHDASAVSYVNTTSGLTATDAQAAIDEVEGRLDTAETGISNHLADAVDAHDASAISYVNATSGLTATDAQAAIDEIEGRVDTLEGDTGLSDHLNDTVDAHDASAISNVPSGNLVATDVQAALNELQTDVDTRATSTALSNHTSDTANPHSVTAAQVGNTTAQWNANQLYGKNIDDLSVTPPTDGQVLVWDNAASKFKAGDMTGGSGVGDADTLSVDNADDSTPGNFTFSTNASISTSNPINGTDVFQLLHQASGTESVKKNAFAISPKFRGKNLTIEFDFNSDASSGNVTLDVYDETNAAYLMQNQSVEAYSSTTSSRKRSYTFDCPATCASMSYTVKGLQETGKTSRFDDVTLKLTKRETSEIVETSAGENIFSARISNNGTAAIVSQNSPFISSVSRTAAGKVTVNFITDFFSVAPSIVSSSLENPAGNLGIQIESITASSLTILTQTYTEVAQDHDFTFVLQRQGADYIYPTTILKEERSTFKEVMSDSKKQFIGYNGAGSTMSFSGSRLVFTLGSFSSTGDGLIAIANDGPTYTTFTAQEDCLVNLSYVSWNTVANAELKLFVNGTQVMSSDRVFQANDAADISANLALNAGDKFYFEWSAGNFRTDAVNYLTISALKQAGILQTAPDSKVEIPTTEIVYKPNSGKGTGAEATTLAFSTLESIRGSALSIDNTNGTKITVLKDGIIDVSAILLPTSGSPASLYISKNAANPSSIPSASETLTVIDVPAIVYWQAISASAYVKAGDVIRFATNVPLSYGNAWTGFRILHQEQNVQVAVSNVEPQFETVDSMIRLQTASGYGSTNTCIRRFSSIVDNLGSDITYADSATDGASFTINKSGVYLISYSDNFVTAAHMGISLNGTQLSTSINNLTNYNEVLAIDTSSAANFYGLATWQGYLEAGDVIRAHADATASGTGTKSRFTIAKQALPSVTGVDVTPFMFKNLGPDTPKQYSEANGDFTVTGSGWTTTSAVIIPYKTSDGTWRMRFNITGSHSSVTYQSINVSGIKFPSYVQGVSANWGSGSSTGSAADAIADSNTIEMTATTSFSGMAVSGDVELTGKPTWASDLQVQPSEHLINPLETVRPVGYSHTTGTSIASGGSAKIIDFSTKRFDDDSLVTTGSSWKYTCPSDGVYSVTSKIVLAATAGWDVGEQAEIVIHKNGTLTSRNLQVNKVANSLEMTLDISDMIECVAGDYLDVRVYHSNGSAINLVTNSYDNTVSIHKIDQNATLGKYPTILPGYVLADINANEGWEQFTPTGSWTTGVTYTGYKRKVGDTLEVQMEVYVDSAPTGTLGSINLPDGLSIDTTKTETFFGSPLGDVVIYDLTGNTYRGHIGYNTATALRPFEFNSSTNARQNIAATGGNITFAAGDRVQMYYRVPILGWSATSEHVVTTANTPRSYSEANGDFTITGAGWTTLESKIVYYTGAEGEHRIKFNILGTVAGLSGGNNLNPFINISGVTFPLYEQAVSVYSGNVQAFSYPGLVGYTRQVGSGELAILWNGSTTRNGTWGVSGDVEVISKPTWADDVTSNYLAAVTVPKTCYLKDIKSSGTHGGTFTSGSWQTRTLNTIEGDSSVIVSLSSNQFTLNPGTYEVIGSAPARGPDSHRAAILDVTHSSVVIFGTTEWAPNSAAPTTRSHLLGTITVTEQSVFELQHRGSTTVGVDGFGPATGFGDSEVYSELKITRIK